MIGIATYRAFGKVIYLQIQTGGSVAEEELELILELVDAELLPRTAKARAEEQRRWAGMFDFGEEGDFPRNVRVAFDEWLATMERENWDDWRPLREKWMRILEAIAEKYGLVDADHRALLGEFRQALLSDDAGHSRQK